MIEKVDEPTDWVSSIVFSRKSNGKLRICLDPKDLHKLKLPTFSTDFPMMEAVDRSRTEGILSCNYAIRLLIEITTKVRLVSYWQVGPIGPM